MTAAAACRVLVVCVCVAPALLHACPHFYQASERHWRVFAFSQCVYAVFLSVYVCVLAKLGRGVDVWVCAHFNFILRRKNSTNSI